MSKMFKKGWMDGNFRPCFKAHFQRTLGQSIKSPNNISKSRIRLIELKSFNIKILGLSVMRTVPQLSQPFNVTGDDAVTSLKGIGSH